MRASPRRLVAALACLGLVAASCGGDDDDDSASTNPADDTGGEPSDDTGGTDTGDTGEAPSTGDIDPASIEFDVGVDEDTITIGILGDYSGAFAPLVQEVVAAQKVYWDDVNKNGGIAGRQIEVLEEDNAYDVQTNVQKYDVLRDKVAMLSQVTGSPHTAAIQPQMVDDNIVGIPLTWYSGWADPEIGENVAETYTNYCLESMNGVEWLHKNKDVQTVAIVSFAGEFGGDGAAGANMAAEELGLEVVYDGSEQVATPTAEDPNPDQSSVISKIVDANPDLVWAVVNPTALTSIMQGAIDQGYKGLWSGNSPTYSFKLLSTDAAKALDQYYIASTYIVTWGADVPGMKEVVDKMTAAQPNLKVSDVYILGWTEAMIAEAILTKAAENGDMTREGIVKASEEVTVDFNGLGPTQTWSGEPNDNLVRESYIYDVALDQYNDASLKAGGGSTGWELLEGPYTGDLVQNYEWDGPCYVGG